MVALFFFFLSIIAQMASTGQKAHWNQEIYERTILEKKKKKDIYKYIWRSWHIDNPKYSLLFQIHLDLKFEICLT